MTDSDLKEIVGAIQSGAAEHLWSQSHRVSAFAVRLHERVLPVVYDRKRKCVCTVLPIEVLELSGYAEQAAAVS